MANSSIDGGYYGQNIAAGTSPANVATVITTEFYNNEVVSYNPAWYGHEPNLTTFDSYGHFTQVVWSNTLSVGCYTADCSHQGIQGLPSDILPWFTVCNYYPPGRFFLFLDVHS